MPTPSPVFGSHRAYGTAKRKTPPGRPSPQAFAVRRLIGLCRWLAVLSALWATVGMAAQPNGKAISVKVPVKDGRYYDASAFQKLLLGPPPQKTKPRWVELTPLDQLALQLAHASGILQVTWHYDSRGRLAAFTIRIPSDEESQKKFRKWAVRTFGLPVEQWLAQYRLHLPGDYQGQSPLVVVLHGLESGPARLKRFQQACRATGLACAAFVYPNDGAVRHAAELLSRQLKAFRRKYPQVRIVLVAHSMGGLVARWCLETPCLNPGGVSDLFTLGTPHQGSQMAELAELAELVELIQQRDLRWWQTWFDGNGEAAQDLLPGSKLLRELNSRQPAPGVRYHLAAGTRSFLSQEELRQFRRVIFRWLDSPRLSDKQRRWLLTLLSAPELIDGQADGCVTVRSALGCPHAHQKKKFPLTHTQLLELPGNPPQQSPVFRWIVENIPALATESSP